MNMNEARHFTVDGLRGTLRHDVDMSRHVTWRAGGRADRVYQPADLADLLIFLRTLPADEPVVAVGLGSNLLVRDGGLRGTVLLLHAALGELRIEPDGTLSPQGGGRGCKAAEAATTTLYVQAGVPGAKLARFAARNNLGGAEFFAGIPGTLGGMLAMNAGCYGSDTWGVVARVQAVTRTGVLHERVPAEYDIAYRHVLAHSADEEWFVAAWLRLPAGDGEIARQQIKALLSKRIASQPLNLPNAGSVFRNPLGDHAARLIEQCGLKGRQIGGARVSEKHANFIVNVGGATAADIEHLINEVQAVVWQQTGIELRPEVRIIGEAA
ncbi:UDP-N-acetylmuramate dehydrogenase [Rhodocyclaceae bacterium]|nr:UDP-N-acetylmuramate dehydrogenase [Rhodocyclaceae bacterium]